MSASLQYSNYSGKTDFVIPYEILAAWAEIQALYVNSCQADMDCYEQLCNAGISHDAAGYATPQGLRNVLLLSATPFQWKHMIGQRCCRRNTDETQIVMLKIWQDLNELSPTIFHPKHTGPYCQRGKCMEGKMSCGTPINQNLLPKDILQQNYPLLLGGGQNED